MGFQPEFRTMPCVDVTAVAMLQDLDASLDREAVGLVFARNVGLVRDVVGRAVNGAGAARTPLYPTVQAAVDAVRREPGRSSP